MRFSNDKSIASKRELEEKDLKFQADQEEWHKTKSKSAWDAMFLAVYFAIETAMKKRLKGIYRSDIHDLITDATITVMSRYHRIPEYRVKSLASVAHWAVIGSLYGTKQQRIDRELSYEQLLETGVSIQ